MPKFRFPFIMRYATFYAICSLVVFCVLVRPLLLQVLDLYDQYAASDYLSSSLWDYGDDPYEPAPGVSAGDKVIVMAALESYNTSWVAAWLPDWQRAIYIVNPTEPSSSSSSSSSDLLTTPVNKGREAMAYLTYIIDNYHNSLPSVMAFLHSHRKGFLEAWHNDAPLHDNVVAMRSLQLDFVIQNGFVNLRCNTNPGCTPGFRRLRPHITGEVWQEIFSGTTTLPITENATDVADEPESTREDRAHARSAHMGVAAACCAQFAVSRTQVHRRPLEDYVKIRQWLMDTTRDDAHSGRILEYLWHVIFGKDVV